jgi:hypothetical protein
MIYYSYVHLILKYANIFLGNAPLSSSTFKIQKIIIRVMSEAGKFDSCRDLFKKLQILPLQYQYIFSLLLFNVKKKNYFTSNMTIHDINTCNNYNLNLPSTKISVVQKGVLSSGRKIYNHLPTNTKLLSGDIKDFKSLLRSYLTNIQSIGWILQNYFPLTSSTLVSFKPCDSC